MEDLEGNGEGVNVIKLYYLKYFYENMQTIY